MKKSYIHPTIDIESVICIQVLCASDSDVNQGDRYEDSETEYIESFLEDEWNIGSPD
ncbi:MAG: hypothetical protein KBT06_02365 [Prevotellaceae bacterium]|nr:hypothetical protein [Candidatus Colivivens equi]MCQ2076062.1 hypothetical protein [Bacteroidaceae bacterium]